MSSPFHRTVMICAASLITCLALAPPAESRDLRFCADANNLPFSKRDGSGFENRIAEIIAEELIATPRFIWSRQGRGFLRKTLKAGTCDVVMGFPPNPQVLRPTRPYYRSSYVFVHKPDLPTIRSFEDPALRKLTVGVQLIGDDGANTPPVHALAQRGIVANIRGFMVYGNAQAEAPLSPVVDAVADGRVDVAIVWGPAAGYFVKHAGVPLRLTPVLIDPAHLALPMTFDIAAGVRKEDQVLATEINNALTARKADIDAVLAEFGVPRVDGVSTVDQP